MSKGRYILLCALAAFSLVGVTALHETPTMIKAIDTSSTTYTRSVTITPSMLSNQRHASMTIMVNGLEVTIDPDVFCQEGYICFNNTRDTASMSFPHSVNSAGAHGVGYANVRFGPLVEGGDYCQTVGIYYRPSTDEGITVKVRDVPAGSPYYDLEVNQTKNYLVGAYSNYTNSKSARTTYLTVVDLTFARSPLVGVIDLTITPLGLFLF